MKILPCRWSIRWEKRFVTAILRPSSADGRSVGSSSGIGVDCAFPAAGGGDDGVEAAASDGVDGGGGGLGESAKCRACVRILHCIQVDGRSGARLLDIRRDCLAVEDAIESRRKSLGTNRASGCMAGVPFLSSRSGGLVDWRAIKECEWC